MEPDLEVMEETAVVEGKEEEEEETKVVDEMEVVKEMEAMEEKKEEDKVDPETTMKLKLRTKYEALLMQKPDFARKLTEKDWTGRSAWDLLGSVSQLENQVGLANLLADLSHAVPELRVGSGQRNGRGRRSRRNKALPPPLSFILRQSNKPAGIYKESTSDCLTTSKAKNKAKAFARALKKAALKLQEPPAGGKVNEL